MYRKEVILTRTKQAKPILGFSECTKKQNERLLISSLSPLFEHRALKREGISRGVLVRVGTIGHQVVPKHLNTSMYYN